MQSTAHLLKENAKRALRDEELQRALKHVRKKFIVKRQEAAQALPEFDRLRDHARAVKDHVLSHLDDYLIKFEGAVQKVGGQVHWCSTPESANQTILDICRRANAKTVTKGKTMVGEEIGINDYLKKNGITPIETDLGEYIIQLRNETPSHIIAPAVHVTKKEVEHTFRKEHKDLDPNRSLEEPEALLAEARKKLRDRFLAADVGITGANFLIAETGSCVIVTNEGNGDLTQLLPPVHIVLASIEKIVPTLDDAAIFLRLLARSATGQEMSVYTTFATGPKREKDLDGPKEFHVILLDNGRSSLLGGEFEDMLRCIRCGACLNHCPVYHAIGGHAYGWVYPGPIGAILAPALMGIEKAGPLPEASTFCGRCEEVCPVRIPIPKILRHWRERSWKRADGSISQKQQERWLIGIWRWFALRPKFYRYFARYLARFLKMAGRRGRLAPPEGRTFLDLYGAREKAKRQ